MFVIVPDQSYSRKRSSRDWLYQICPQLPEACDWWNLGERNDYYKPVLNDTRLILIRREQKQKLLM